MKTAADFAVMAMKADADAQLAMDAVVALRDQLEARLESARAELNAFLKDSLTENASKRAGENVAEIITRFAEIRHTFKNELDAKILEIRAEADRVFAEAKIAEVNAASERAFTEAATKIREELNADNSQRMVETKLELLAQNAASIAQFSKQMRKDMERQTQEALAKTFEKQPGAPKNALLDSFRGEFNIETLYQPGDTFGSRGGFYLVLKETRGRQPSRELIKEGVFGLLSAPGAPGQKGEQGPAGDNGTGITTSLSITYTGTPQTNLVFPILPAVILSNRTAGTGSPETLTALTGKCIGTFAYSETSAAVGNRLTTLTFNDLAMTQGNIGCQNCTALTSLSFPELVFVAGNFNTGTVAVLTTLSTPMLETVGTYNVSGLTALTTLSAPALTTCTGSFNPSAAALTTFDFPLLARVGNSFSPTGMIALASMPLPSLASVGGVFAPTSMSTLTAFTADALQTVGGAFSLASMASLTTASFSGMVAYGSTITMNSGLGALTSVTLGTIGTLKSINGATINISGQALTSASVNAILALLVSLDGTGGTTEWGAGKTLNVSGGTSGAPTGQGATDKTTLQGRGATITTN